MHETDTAYDKATLPEYCDKLAARDKRLKRTLSNYGYPSFWHRDPGFAGLIRIILEQQVSLQSAYATYRKLEGFVGKISPESVLQLSDEELKTCGFSRQKTRYARELSMAVQNGLNLDTLKSAPDREVRESLTAIKGIGDWTVNVYLLLSLHRLDVFPGGDLALVKSMRTLGFIKQEEGSREARMVAEKFTPYRSVFAVLLWHAYVTENNVVMP